MTLHRNTKQKIWMALGVTAILALLLLLAFSGENFYLLKSLLTRELSNEELKVLLRGFGWRGYIAVAMLSALQVICAFLPAEPAQVLAGFTFGFPVGLLCCMVGVFLGNTLIYILQSLFGDRLRGFFIKKLHLDLEAISKSGKCVLLIFVLYFLPAIPYGMICFFAASTGLSYRRYITVTLLGALPSVCIGVGLGYMALATTWVVSVCVFVVLLLLLVVMYLKKDLLFSKLNGYAGKTKGTSKNKVRNVNGFVMNTVYVAARVYLFFCGVKIRATNKVGKPQSPSMVLCNHGSFIDFVYVTVLLRKYRPNFVVARLYFYNTWLGWLLRHVGAFPKSMFTTDIESVKNCLTVLKEKNHLAMMPEARLSTVGRFEDIQESTFSFIKKAGVAVYTVKLNGAYFADPKWSKGFRRGAEVEAELDLLFTAEQVAALSVEEIKAGVEGRLRYDEFAWLAERPHIHYRVKTIAEGLENILTTCPTCGEKHCLYTKGNGIYCERCGFLAAMDDRYGFQKDFRFANFAEWYDWQNDLLKQEIARNEDFSLTAKVELRLPSGGSGLTRHGGQGVCTLNREGLTYQGTKDGQTVTLNYPVRRFYRLLFGAGENFEFYDGAEILYFVPEEKRSAVEWYTASGILYNQTETVQV